MSKAATAFTLSPVPTSAQTDLMNHDWTQSSVTEAKNPGKIGMFGKGDDYYFYMDFVANNSVDLWS